MSDHGKKVTVPSLGDFDFLVIFGTHEVKVSWTLRLLRDLRSLKSTLTLTEHPEVDRLIDTEGRLTGNLI